jgi:hypothetical protein
MLVWMNPVQVNRDDGESGHPPQESMHRSLLYYAVIHLRGCLPHLNRITSMIKPIQDSHQS